MRPGRRLGLSAGTLLLAFALPLPAHAQGFLVDLYAGVAKPIGRLADLTKAGFSGGLGAGYDFGRFLGFRTDFAGEWLSSREPPLSEPVPGLSGLEADDLRLFHFDGALVLHVTDPRSRGWNLALDAGAGATTIQFRGEGPRPGSETRFTIPLGFTAGYRVADTIGLFIRARYFIIFVDEARFGSSTWGSLPLWAGVRIRTG